MLLRESGQAIGQSPDLAAAVHEPGSGGVPHGKVIVEFGDAVTRGADAAEPARRALIDAVGADGFVAAAAIVLEETDDTTRPFIHSATLDYNDDNRILRVYVSETLTGSATVITDMDLSDAAGGGDDPVVKHNAFPTISASRFQ